VTAGETGGKKPPESHETTRELVRKYRIFEKFAELTPNGGDISPDVEAAIVAIIDAQISRPIDAEKGLPWIKRPKLKGKASPHALLTRDATYRALLGSVAAKRAGQEALKAVDQALREALPAAVTPKRRRMIALFIVLDIERILYAPSDEHPAVLRSILRRSGRRAR
jgi:hypothetical protein